MLQNDLNTESLSNVLQLWSEYFPTYELPPSSFFSFWKSQPERDVEYGLSVTRRWATHHLDADSDEIARFTCGVMKHTREDRRILHQLASANQSKR
jgi:hypothetical protein